MSNHRSFRLLRPILATILFVPASARAQSEFPKEATTIRRPFARPETPRRLERIRVFDVRHVRGDLVLDTKKSEVRGTVTHTLAPLHPHLNRVELDCGKALKVSGVTVGPKGTPCTFEQDRETLKVTLDRDYGPDETFPLAIAYAGSPGQGIHFIKPDPAEPDKPLAVWTQGEAEETHDWLPCYDAPNDRATSEMVVTVEKPLMVVSNGDLIEVKENADGTATYHWKMDVPHSSYLISIAASDFAAYHDKSGDLPVDYYVARSVDEATARRAFGHTPAMIAFFGERTGEPYPYAKYAQVVVPGFSWGGMENISASTLNDRTLRDAVAALEGDSDSLVAHELAHQWFGDLLTCEDWSQIWLNEGFASYFDALYAEHAKGEDAFRIEMENNLRHYIDSDRAYRRPIVESRYDNPVRMFDSVTYAKGSCVLHALRGLIGDDAWWAGIRRYVAENKGRVVATDDLRKAMEAASGRELTWFFDQWVAKAGHPELDLRWRFEPDDKTVRVQVRQTQHVDEITPLFRLPTTLELADGMSTRSIPIVIDDVQQTFIIPATAAPKMVRIDPKGWVIKEMTFDKPLDEWAYQLEHAPGALGRLEAARALAKQTGKAEAVAALAPAVPREKEPAARVVLVEQLAAHGEAARPALRLAAKDPEARVRAVAFETLAKLKRDPDDEKIFRAALDDAKEAYGVRRAALRGLVGWKVAERGALLAKALETPSYQGTIASTALGLLLQEPGTPARETAVLYSKAGRPVPLRLAAIGGLRRLAKDDQALQDELIALAEDPNRLVRSSAWSALAQIGTKRALPALEHRLAREESFSKARLEDAISVLKGGEAPKPAADEGREIAELEREAADFELRAKEVRNRAEALRLKAERAKLAPVSKP